LVAGLVLLLFIVIYVSQNPALPALIGSEGSGLSPELVETLAPTLLNDPVVLMAVLVGLGIVGPLIEELLKPLGVYLLLRRKLSEEQGFALGAITGAGFALFENLALNASPDTLFIGAIGRFGASAMHIATAALSGWALARAVKQKRFLPLAGILGLNIFIHGLWNSLVVLFVAGALTEASGGGLVPSAFIIIGPLVLFIIVLSFLFMLRRFNRRFAITI
jgi:RsiW-degrading membrane proteinase PrsW (M82 family)